VDLRVSSAGASAKTPGSLREGGRAWWSSLEEVVDRLAVKVGKIISHHGPSALPKPGKDRRELRPATGCMRIQSGRTDSLGVSRRLCGPIRQPARMVRADAIS
jgi:hypothetical protein